MKRCLFLCLCFLAFSSAGVPWSGRTGPQPRGKQGSFCGTYPGRVHDVLRQSGELQKVLKAGRTRQALSAANDRSQDVGHVAVIEDDGTIVAPFNLFDLTDKTLRLTHVSSGTYALSVRDGILNPDLGTKLPLTDDDFSEIHFKSGFGFSFFGVSYTSIFINSDGNVTFNQGGAEHTPRDLSRLNDGPPRIAPFLVDLDPQAGAGGVYYNQLSDRFQITWYRIREFDKTTESTFQLSLFQDGTMEFTFGSVQVQSVVTGWSSGMGLQPVTLVDLSTETGMTLSGPEAERFTSSTEVDFASLSKKFYQTHPDDFDQLVIFTNFPYDLGDAFAFEFTINNSIQGIHVDQMDFSQQFGSQGVLQSILAMNQLAEFPNNPDTVFFGTNSSMGIMGQESGHRWLVFAQFLDGGSPSNDLLGRDFAHWSFFFNSEASVMEGNEIRDNGDGSFTTIGTTSRYNKLDQYLMGLRDSSEVDPVYYVTNVSGTRRVPSSPPAIGVTFSGTRRNLTVNDIIAAEGPRIPDASDSPKVFRQAFVLLVRRGTTPLPAEVEKLDSIRRRWQDFYRQATDSRGTAQTTLTSLPLVPSITQVSPASGSTQGNTVVYISGQNFQDGGKVSFGSNEALDIRLVNPNLIVARTPPGIAGPRDVVVQNPESAPAVLANGFTYRTLVPIFLSANALRIPFAIDSQAYRTNLGVNNPNPQTAIVKLTLVDENGLVLSQQDGVSIPPNGYLQKNSVLRELEGIVQISGRQGSLVMESAQSIGAFASQIDNVSGDPSILEGMRQGSSHLILQSAANTGPFRSDLTLTNLSDIDARVTLTAIDRATGRAFGSPLQNLSIPANGFVRFENVLAALGANDSYGPVDIRSTNGALLAAVSNVSGLNANTSGFFIAQDADQGTQAEFIPFVVDTTDFRTNLGINNLGPSPASVDLAFIDFTGKVRASTTTPVQVISRGLVQINNVLRFLLNGSGNSGVTQQWGYLKITSNQPIKAYATQIDNTTNDPSIEVSKSAGDSRLLLKSSSNAGFRSTLTVLNLSASAAQLTLTSREGNPVGNGTITGSHIVDIPPGGAYLTENLLGEIGSTSSFGPVEIREASNLPLIAISRVYDAARRTSGFFNTEPFP